MMDFSSSILLASTPHSSVMADNSSVSITERAAFDCFSESMKSWNSKISDNYGDGWPSPQAHHDLSYRSLGINSSFQNNNNESFYQRAISPPSSDYPVKRMFYSAGDFQNYNQIGESRSSVSCESNITIEGFMISRACRYSPEEKKERIERYKTKRNQRNFNKKIKYACRKSLADKRPRIRGRFARYSEEIGNNYGVQWSDGQDEEDEANGNNDNWLKYIIDAYSANLIP